MRVAILEDAALLRAGLVSLLADEDIETVAAVSTAEEFLTAVREHRPDIAIVDVRLPPTFIDEGLRAAIEARRIVAGLPVLVLSQSVEETYAAELFAHGASGVGYLLKERIADVVSFVDALKRVAAGGTAIDPEVVSQLMARRRRRPVDMLTPREAEILALMAQGLSNTAIQKSLTVSLGTVEKHIANIFAKLGIGTGDGSANHRVRAVLIYLGHDQA